MGNLVWEKPVLVTKHDVTKINRIMYFYSIEIEVEGWNRIDTMCIVKKFWGFWIAVDLSMLISIVAVCIREPTLLEILTKIDKLFSFF